MPGLVGIINKKNKTKNLVDLNTMLNCMMHEHIYNTGKFIDEDLGLRASMFQEGIRLLEDLLRNNIQTIIFGRTRKFVEALLIQLRLSDSLNDALGPKNINKKIRAYRSGYLPKHRREIESSLRTGEIRAVVATSALELGLDIGQLDASVIMGFPGSISGGQSI